MKLSLSLICIVYVLFNSTCIKLLTCNKMNYILLTLHSRAVSLVEHQ